MGYTFSEKVLMKYSGKGSLRPGDIVTIEPHMVMSHDNSAFIAKKFYETGLRRVWNKDRIVIIFDHTVPAINAEHERNHQEVREFVREQGITHFYDTKAGVSHQVMMEKGHVLPGEIVMGSDSHSTLYGAMGALGVPINRTEMAGIWATGKIWLKVPQTIKIILEGELSPGVYSKDIILKLLSELRADGATYRTIEFCGSAVRRMSMSSRMTLGNMAVELGAKAGVVEFDDVTREYLKGRISTIYEPVFADKDADYEKVIRIDISSLEPQVACPHNVDNIRPISQVTDVKVDQGYLGSCTNGRLEDLRIAASILKGRKVADGVRLVVYPASKEVMDAARSDGTLRILEDSGALTMTASCGPCFGTVGATLNDNEVCISSSNRNFRGRMGSKESFVYLSSPAVVAASCIEGRIADPRKYLTGMKVEA